MNSNNLVCPTHQMVVEDSSYVTTATQDFRGRPAQSRHLLLVDKTTTKHPSQTMGVSSVWNTRRPSTGSSNRYP